MGAVTLRDINIKYSTVGHENTVFESRCLLPTFAELQFAMQRTRISSSH